MVFLAHLHPIMEAELSRLEERIETVVAFCESLREQNRELRSHVAALEDEKRALTDKIDTTLARLEALMDRLPEQ